MKKKAHRNALEAGQDLHWYVIQDVLGVGGFGITYLAHDNNLQQQVAIKEYLPSGTAIRESDKTVHPYSEQDNDKYHWGLDRFLSEARTLTQFDHPNIVRVLTVFEMNGTAYMVMRYEQGKGLDRYLPKGKKLPEKWLKNMISQLADGLTKVHSAGFIHRDIKPPNIFIRDDQSPVLIDFGSARQAVGQETHTLTAMVSPGYAPFEQYHARSNQQGPWTDIYGLGATLYRAVTGEGPIDALQRSEAIIKGKADPYESCLNKASSKYTPAFLDAIDQALAFHEEERPQELDSWLELLMHEGEVTERVSTTTPLTPPTTPTAAKPATKATVAEPITSTEKPKPATNNHTLTWIIAIILGVALYIVQPWRALSRLFIPPPAANNTVDTSTPEQTTNLADIQSSQTDNIIQQHQQTLRNNPQDELARSSLETLSEYHLTLGLRAAEEGRPNEAKAELGRAWQAALNDDQRASIHAQAALLGIQL